MALDSGCGGYSFFAFKSIFKDYDGTKEPSGRLEVFIAVCAKVLEKYLSDDNRHTQRNNEKEILGLPSRDTWNLDTTMLVLLYERLKHFKEIAITDIEGSLSVFEYEGEIKTLLDMINHILELSEIVLKDEVDLDHKEYSNHSTRIWEAWTLIHKDVWWPKHATKRLQAGRGE